MLTRLHLLLLITCLLSAPLAWSEGAFLSNQINKPTLQTEQSFPPVNEVFSVIVTQKNNDYLTLEWKITDGYYLYKSRFKFESPDFAVGNAVLPMGEVVDDPYIGKTQIYTHNFDMQLPVDTVKKLTTANLIVTFQGCAKAGFCYPPETITAPININTAALNNDSNQNNLASTRTATTHISTPSASLYLFFALIGGLILNLMPCVFPVLSIKVLSFATHSENPHYLKLHGFVYTAGVILSFIAIAGLLMYLRAAGATIGWGFQLQNPPFITSLIILFFLMSLHLFGFFSLEQLFSIFSTSKAHTFTQGHHLKASFFTGLLSVVVATPCTVPFMAPAIGFALTQSTVTALSIFSVLGLGLALPFLILTHFPQLIARLPKPGAWMEHLKQLLAFPLLLTAIWLLWVLGHQTSINHVITVSTLCVALTFAIWLWTLNYKKILIFLLAAAGFIYGINITQQKNVAEPFTQLRFNELRTSGEPIFINMTADWCITCLVNEKVALSSEDVKNTFAAHKVHYLKGDWTNQNPEITAFLKTFNRSGIPLYVFYPEGSLSEPMILPQLLTPAIVIDTVSTNKNKQIDK